MSRHKFIPTWGVTLLAILLLTEKALAPAPCNSHTFGDHDVWAVACARDETQENKPPTIWWMAMTSAPWYEQYIKVVGVVWATYDGESDSVNIWLGESWKAPGKEVDIEDSAVSYEPWRATIESYHRYVTWDNRQFETTERATAHAYWTIEGRRPGKGSLEP
ncbi:MAG: hypothetical protein ONB07_08790 [candidate division KSB1 bacterium]|nr:hypothetical protein [candidate division KSB1 bacterium]MDZ7391718.1 hypothetical protein [candidate division KSB1 bacterium]